ncbi:TetR-like C-terminal domain-containing protein [Companilactobacillus huachuanensis]|uniref:TetR-like C-terminal domain-containing protein n=1 Tax=Companilactobacillus huachuanensis TaxID=2559914 RepID=A0ABW1RQ66_9LACO|nr:TetR-like C-terminal domain-containing protein [Companilactobacillus huachuanensis]
MEDVYKTVFEEIILKNVTENSKTFEDIINNFINYVSNNKIFCLNLYKETEEKIVFQKIIKLLNDLIINYCEDTDSKDRLYLIVGYIRIFQQWSTERYYILSAEVIEEIRKNLLLNHKEVFG